MALPAQIKIGSSQWSIIVRPSLTDEGDKGKCYKDRAEIHLTDDIPPSQQEITLLHEVLHACCDFVGIREGKLEEEEFVTRLAPILHTVLKDNGFWS